MSTSTELPAMTFENIETKEYLEKYKNLSAVKQEQQLATFCKKNSVDKRVIRKAITDKIFEYWPPEPLPECDCESGGCGGLNMALSDEIALKILKDHKIRTVLESKTMLQFKNGGWVDLDETELAVMGQKIGGETGVSNKDIEEAIGRIKRDNLISIEDFERRPDLFMDANGSVFNTLTRQFEEVIAKDVTVIHKIGAVFKPEIAVPQDFLNILELIVPDPVERSTLQEHVGSCMYRKMIYDKAVIIFGRTRNGKTTIMDILMKVIGEANTATTSLQDLSKNFRLFMLWRKMFNSMDDLSTDAVRNTSAFKILHGGAKITIEQKYEKPFQAYIYAKSIFGCNLLPPAANKDDDGYYTKIIIIHAPNTFLLKNEIGSDGLQDGEYHADPDLVARLTSDPDNLSGILNWMLEGLHRLNEQKSYSKILTQEEGKAEYNALAAPEGELGAFIRSICNIDGSSMVRKADLLALYRVYCQVKKIQSPSMHEFNKTLKILGFNPDYRKIGYAEKPVYAMYDTDQKSPFLITRLKFRDEWETILKNMKRMIEGLEPIPEPSTPTVRPEASRKEYVDPQRMIV